MLIAGGEPAARPPPPPPPQRGGHRTIGGVGRASGAGGVGWSLPAVPLDKVGICMRGQGKPPRGVQRPKPPNEAARSAPLLAATALRDTTLTACATLRCLVRNTLPRKCIQFGPVSRDLHGSEHPISKRRSVYIPQNRVWLAITSRGCLHCLEHPLDPYFASTHPDFETSFLIQNNLYIHEVTIHIHTLPYLK